MNKVAVTATTLDGQEMKYEVYYPESSEEIFYRHYLGYLQQNALCNKAAQEEEPDTSLLAFHRSEALSEICPQVKELTFDNPELAFQALTIINDKVSEAMHKFEKPNNNIQYSVTIDGQEYTLDKWRAAKALGFKKLSTYEAVEYLEMNRIYQKDLDEFKDNAAEYNFGKQFVLSTQSIAMLLRKPKEKLPRNPVELRDWLKERCKIFNDLPLSVHNAVSFFLLRTLLESSQTQNTSTPSNLYHVLGEGKKVPSKYGWKVKPKRLQKALGKR